MRISMALLLVAGWAGLAVPAAAQQDCPSNFTGQRGNTAPLTCFCPPGAAAGTVWGSLTYTDDSSICAAAVHAGVISAAGGPVTVQASGGCPSFEGSTRNGVTTTNYGPWQSSFFFPSAGGGKCAGGAAAGGAGRAQTCPANFTNQTQPLTCFCPPGATSGSVWGTLTYSDDSAICAAAVHAGAIPASGGEVTVQPAPGCSSYTPSVRNGVSTLPYGAWGHSFVFPSVGGGKC